MTATNRDDLLLDLICIARMNGKRRPTQARS
jgi:hypothetical protein